MDLNLEDTSKNIEPVFLNDGRFIEWKRPARIQRDGRVYLEPNYKPDASTEVVSFIGFDVFYGNVGEQYYLDASAAKFDTLIAPMGEKIHRYEAGEPTSNKPETMILFAGNITFYSVGKIPGTEIRGYDFVRSGRIFTARKPLEIFRSPLGLKELIFEGNNGTLAKRIKALIRGYEDQELAKEEAQDRLLTETSRRSRNEGLESAFGTFGR
jgi:hypothetical protein